MPTKAHLRFPITCSYCKNPIRTRRDHTWDHVVPRCKGGRNGDNLVHCCRQCNTLKGDHDLEDFLQLLEIITPPRATPPPLVYTPKVEDFHWDPMHHYGLVGAVKVHNDGRKTYTPPPGTGVSKTLRKLLKHKGILVVWDAATAGPSAEQSSTAWNQGVRDALNGRRPNTTKSYPDHHPCHGDYKAGYRQASKKPHYRVYFMLGVWCCKQLGPYKDMTGQLTNGGSFPLT